jgi:hypothetical protein
MGVIVTITDVRMAGHCVAGARDWFRAYDLDFREFVRNGMDSDILLATDDALAKQVIERKLQRESEDG